MSNDLVLELEKNKYSYKNYKFHLITNSLDKKDHLEYIELLMDKKHPLEINTSLNSDNNSNPHSNDEDNQKKRNNSYKPKKKYDIDDYFLKDLTIFSWLSLNEDAYIKFYRENLDLLKQIFDKRYKLYPNNICSLSDFANHIKNKVDMYCIDDYQMSVFILKILYTNFNKLIEYMDEVIHFETLKIEDFVGIREIIYHIGKDVKKIFKNAVNTIDKTPGFKFSNILVNIFNEYLKNKNILNEQQTIHAALISETKELYNYVKDIYKIKYTSNLTKWVNDPGDEIFERNNMKKKEDKFNDNSLSEPNKKEENDNINNIEKNILIKKSSNKSIKVSANITIKNINEKGNINLNDEQVDDKGNIHFTVIQKEYDNKDVHKLNIEDLVSYINEPKIKTNHKKKQKKKKKTKKDNKDNKNNVDNKKNNEERIDDNRNKNLEEDDSLISDFKRCLEEYSSKNSYIYPKKIEPNISDSFLKKLEIY